jgi:hypothetical protein
MKLCYIVGQTKKVLLIIDTLEIIKHVPPKGRTCGFIDGAAGVTTRAG